MSTSSRPPHRTWTTSSVSRTATAAVEAGPATVWLGLGSNVGDRAANLRHAILALDDVMLVDGISSVYDTEPYGYAAQERFWNLAVRGRTDLGPHALLIELQELERRVGRLPTFRMGPRVIDIDILLYDDVVVDDGDLRVPHPGLVARAFVLQPLLELDPWLRDPAGGEPLARHARELGTEGVVRIGSAGDLLRLPHGVGS